MENRRLELHEKLCTILGSRHVYFQPPESITMRYPAIVYELDSIDQTYADDGVYNFRRQYSITVITDDPDSDLPDKIAVLQTSRFNRHFKSDNLNHYVFSLYF